MTYILDTDGDYVKKCENEKCHNVILIGVSSTKCIKCLEAEGTELIMKIIPYFEQRYML